MQKRNLFTYFYFHFVIAVLNISTVKSKFSQPFVYLPACLTFINYFIIYVNITEESALMVWLLLLPLQ